MARHINDPANTDYDFGYEFNYDVWTANTQLTLTNVRWGNDYRDVVAFDNDTALNNYIDASVSTNVNISNASYASLNEPIKINIPYNRAFKYNYLRASNPSQPVPGSDVKRDYYYFITGMRRSAPNTTIIEVELDVWQTFIRDVQFGRCYVERGHIGLAATNAFDNYGRAHLTVPEGLDIGAEMVTLNKFDERVAQNENVTVFGSAENPQLSSFKSWDALIVSTVDLTQTPNPNDPKVVAAEGVGIQRMDSGANLYIIPGTGTNAGDLDLPTFLNSMKNAPWMAQGIVSITLIPKIRRYNENFTYQRFTPTVAPAEFVVSKIYSLLDNWRNSTQITEKIPSRYRNLKKLFTFPYMVMELTCSNGQPVILRPEAWNNADLRIMERPVFMPPSQRIAFYPRGYNSLKTSSSEYDSVYTNTVGTLPPPYDDLNRIFNRNDADDYGDYLGAFTAITNLPSVPAVNDNAALALANTMHGTAAQRSAANWAQQRAIRSADQNQQNLLAGLGAADEIRQIGNVGAANSLGITQKAQQDSAVLNAIAGIAGGAAGGITGGLPGAAVGVASGAANAIVSGLSLGIQQSAAQSQLTNAQSTEAAQMNRQHQTAISVGKQNQNLANSVAKGDYAATINAIDAQVQDLQMTPPSMLGQYGGDTLNFAYDGLKLSVRVKMIDQNAVARVGEFWLRYGYAIHKFLTPPSNLKCMSKFTYWKMLETYVVSAPMPEFYKQAIRGILEKGVTVWNTPSDIGTVDPATNVALSGISF